MRIQNVYQAAKKTINGMEVNCVINTVSSEVQSIWVTVKECSEVANQLNKLVNKRYVCQQIWKK